MKRLLGAGALFLAVTGTAGVAYLAIPGGSEEEIAQAPQETASPSATVPADSPTPAASPTPSGDLPPPAEGYTWYVAPSNDSGLVRYAVQVPSAWALPSGQFYTNPQYFAPEGIGTFDGPAIFVAVTPTRAVQEEAFRQVLPWQGGTTCGVLPAGQSSAGSYSWYVYDFTCPTVESATCHVVNSDAVTCTSENPAEPVPNFNGRAAEIILGTFYVSVVAFQSQVDSDADAPFQQAITSFTPQ